MKNYFLAILSTILISACYYNNQTKEKDNPPPLYPQPVEIPLNINGGYIINPVTGGSIKPVVTQDGDTLTTGVAIPAVETVIHPNIVRISEIIKAGKPKITLANTNVHPVPAQVLTVELDESQLKKFVVPPIHIIPDTSKQNITFCIQPKPTPALNPRLKDNARYKILYLDEEHGMPSSNVNYAFEDNKGVLWFGTLKDGLIKYDGKNFWQYGEKQGLKARNIQYMINDKDDNIWMYSQYGLFKYDGEKFRKFSKKDGLMENGPAAVFSDKNGNIWMTGDKVVIKYDGKGFTLFTDYEGIRENMIFIVFEDRNGTIWFGGEGGICKLNGNTITYFTTDDIPFLNNVMDIIEDKSGHLWISTRGNGLIKYDGKRFTQFTEKEGLSDNNIWRGTVDQQGNVWVGTLSGGVNKFDGKSFTHLTEKVGLSGNSVLTCLEDRTGNMWFATGAGISKMDKTAFSYFTENELPTNVTFEDINSDNSGK